MKKLLITSVLLLTLTGCGSPDTPAQEAKNIAAGENVAREIATLQVQLKEGEITEKYAQERLKQILKERKKVNSGDTEAILEKIGKEDPMLEKGIAEMIQRRQEAEAASQE